MIRQALRLFFFLLFFSAFFLRAKSQGPIKDAYASSKFQSSIEKKDTLPPAKQPIIKKDSLLPLGQFQQPSRKDTMKPPAQFQEIPVGKDTFFLAKKRGIIGRLAKSISVEPPGPKPVKIANPYLPYAGMIIHNIELVRFGFDRNIYDTTIIKKNFGLTIAKKFHKNTRAEIIANNLLFKSGDHLFPNLLADNERLLRTLTYIQDARILVKLVPGSTDSVDVIVLTKDVFSIGGSANVSSTSRGLFQFKEENFNGSGSRLVLDYLYDKARTPTSGFGAEFVKRNIKGSFIDWTTGFQTYASTFNSGRNEVITIYSGFQKPLVTPYLPWTGGFNVIYNKTNNDYVTDTTYSTLNKYSFYNIDGWYGYNFGSKRLLYKNLGTRLRKFIAVRALDLHFIDIPTVPNSLYNYHYVNTKAGLLALNVFKQDFYRANFIYGFGIDEDVPQGFSASLIGGATQSQGPVNDTILTRDRPYFGLSGEITHFSSKGAYSDYTFRLGGYKFQNELEDFVLLFNVNYFTALKKLGPSWYNRTFVSGSITKQIDPVFNQPLLLQSAFGLPYFSGQLMGDIRTTVGGQSVFFNMKKYLGFRFAPFAFTDLSLLTPSNIGLSKSDLYEAIGGGIRTRNENLVFGTIELKGYYFPRTGPGMNQWRIELNSNLQFRFNSTFIQEPNFISPN